LRILVIKELFKDFGIFKLGPLNFEVRKGEIYALVGPNGSGKTTTLKLIAGTLKKDHGDVILCGDKVNHSGDNFKRKLGFIQDTPFVYPYLSGIEQIFFVASLYGIKKEDARKRVEKFSALFDTQSWISGISRNYSHGMKQKVSIIQALIHDPELLLIDEPLVALDPKAVYNFKNYLKELKKSGKGILMATHSLSFAEEMCDRVGFLKDGKIVIEGRKEDLYKRYNAKNFEEIFIKNL